MTSIPVLLGSQPCDDTTAVTITAYGLGLFREQTVTLDQLRRGLVAVPGVTANVAAQSNGSATDLAPLFVFVPPGTGSIVLNWERVTDHFGQLHCVYRGPTASAEKVTPPPSPPAPIPICPPLSAWQQCVLATYRCT